MNSRHEGIEARRHEVVTTARRDQVRRTHPHSFPLSLVPTPCLRAFVPACLLLSPSAPWRTVQREFCKTKPRVFLSHPPKPARTCPNLPKPAQTCHSVRPWQNEPTRPAIAHSTPRITPPHRSVAGLSPRSRRLRWRLRNPSGSGCSSSARRRCACGGWLWLCERRCGGRRG